MELPLISPTGSPTSVNVAWNEEEYEDYKTESIYEGREVKYISI